LFSMSSDFIERDAFVPDDEIPLIDSLTGFNDLPPEEAAAYFFEPESREDQFNIAYERLFERLYEYFKNRFEPFVKLHSGDLKYERMYRRSSFSKLFALAMKPMDRFVAEDVIEHVRLKLELWSAKRVSGRKRPGMPVYKFSPNQNLIDEIFAALTRFPDDEDSNYGERLLDLIKTSLFRFWRDSTAIDVDDRVDFSYFPSEELRGIMNELIPLLAKSSLTNKGLLLRKIQKFIATADKADVRLAA